MTARVICYPQPGKQKSHDICEAFARGAGGILGDGRAPELGPGPAAFYGVVGIEHLLRQARAEVRDWYYLDNSWFDNSRGTHFRVGVNGLQSLCGAEPDWGRFAALRLKSRAWQANGHHVLVCVQSDPFMREVAGWPGGADGWQNDVLLKLRAHTDRQIIVRHWSRDKTGQAATLGQDLERAWALVTHSSAAANEALLAGVPVFLTGPCAALSMGLSELERIERPRRPDGRREWAAGLAAEQWTLEEMRGGIAWRAITAAREKQSRGPLMRKGWFKIPGVQDGDRTISDQLKGLGWALAETNGKTVLDLGSAEGLISLEFAKAGAKIVHGVELLEDHVAVARRICRAYPQVTFHVSELAGYIKRHPDPAKFDIVLLLGIAHKLHDPGSGVDFACRSALSLIAFRGPGKTETWDGVLKSKFGGGKCHVPTIMADHGFVDEGVVPCAHGERVQYWRRK